MSHYYNTDGNVINYPYIDYIIKAYVPEILNNKKLYRYVNMDIFRESMLHVSSKINETDKTYERLEYLGDAVFHMVITEYLYKRYETENEGFLTKLRIKIERGDSMAQLTVNLGLDQFIQTHGIQLNDHILEDVFEAFIGAFYLNFGIKYTKSFIIKLIEKHKNLSELIYYDDNFKDLLLRYFHQMKWGHPTYEDGSNLFGNKYAGKFVVVVKNPFGKAIGIGVASSKKKSEQLASEKALMKLGVIIDGEIDNNWLEKIEKEEKEAKEKEKTSKKSMSVFNPNNKLMTKIDIREILLNYNISLPKTFNTSIKLFYEAMTHRSYLVRKKLTDEDKKAAKTAVKLQKKSNERLQFLGDAVIHFILGEHLYNKYLDASEGFLTRLRCKLENRDSFI